MTKINLLTLFNNSVSNAALAQKVNFKSSKFQAFQFENLELLKDNFTSNPINANFKTKAEIEQLAKSSPRIMALLKEHNLPLKVNVDILEEMK